MTNLLPKQAGLEVTGVIYRYTAVKDASDDMLVHVQNENALGSGYIFRSTDDWSGLPGNTINKSVPVANIPYEYWGAGSIEVEGKGSVEDSRVIYNYQFDPCFDPQSSPACPGYIQDVTLASFEYEDPLEDPFIKAELEKEAPKKDEDQEEKDRKREKEQKKKERLEVALGAVNSALFTAQAVAQEAQLLAMNVHMTNYQTSMPGGKYEETVEYKDKQLPENPRGLRVGLAQQLLHEEMVQAQYTLQTEK